LVVLRGGLNRSREEGEGGGKKRKVHFDHLACSGYHDRLPPAIERKQERKKENHKSSSAPCVLSRRPAGREGEEKLPMESAGKHGKGENKKRSLARLPTN